MSKTLWNRCLTRLEDELPSQQFNMWIRPLQVSVSADGAEMTLFAPNRFVVDWVRDKYMERIGEVMGEMEQGPLPQLRLEVGSSRVTEIIPKRQAPEPRPA
ncbi:MAG: DnaA N-terminal domain-containing protein, partial [Alloalcanivorax xenomutans]